MLVWLIEQRWKHLDVKLSAADVLNMTPKLTAGWKRSPGGWAVLPKEELNSLENSGGPSLQYVIND